MSDNEPTVVERYEATPEGRREMAAARLTTDFEEVLRSAYERSGMTLEEFADGLGVSPNRAIVILNSDGFIKMSTAAKALAVLGCDIELVVTDRDGHPVPAKTPRRSLR